MIRCGSYGRLRCLFQGAIRGEPGSWLTISRRPAALYRRVIVYFLLAGYAVQSNGMIATLDKAQELLTRWWGASDWAARVELLKSAAWLMRVGDRQPAPPVADAPRPGEAPVGSLQSSPARRRRTPQPASVASISPATK